MTNTLAKSIANTNPNTFVTIPFYCLLHYSKRSKVAITSHIGPLARHWSPFLQPSARHQLTLRDHEYVATVAHGVPVYSLAFAGTKLYCLVTEGRTHPCPEFGWNSVQLNKFIRHNQNKPINLWRFHLFQKPILNFWVLNFWVLVFEWRPLK